MKVPPNFKGVCWKMVKARKTYAKGKTSITSHGVHELVLWAENNEHLYRQMDSWSKNFAMKMRRGIFNRSLAVKGLANHLVANTQKDYKKKFGRDMLDYGIPISMSLTDKRKVASKLLPSIIEDAKYKLKNMKPLKKKK